MHGEGLGPKGELLSRLLAFSSQLHTTMTSPRGVRRPSFETTPHWLPGAPRRSGDATRSSRAIAPRVQLFPLSRRLCALGVFVISAPVQYLTVSLFDALRRNFFRTRTQSRRAHHFKIFDVGQAGSSLEREFTHDMVDFATALHTLSQRLAAVRDTGLLQPAHNCRVVPLV